MEVLYDRDADQTYLRGKTIAVLGYGSQGHAHALNLKDSGMDVVVGVRPGASWNKAEQTGLKVMPPSDAVKIANIVMVLVPDELQAALYVADIAPNLQRSSYLAFGHGFNIHFGQIFVM